jgi:CRP/FNR family cyclic AMP-dependent transcriptional regulator
MAMGTTLPQKQVLARFLEHCHVHTYPAKTVIINAGDFSDELYYLVRGSVSVVMEDESGREIVLAYLNEGDFFGEIGMFEERHKRTAWVCTRTRCEVAQISYEKLHGLSVDHPEILFAMLAQLVRRLRDMNLKVSDLAFTDVAGRIASALLNLCQQPDALTHPDGMQLRITRQELSRLVGCSREMVGRVLKDLEAQNLIEVKGRTIVVYGTR